MSLGLVREREVSLRPPPSPPSPLSSPLSLLPPSPPLLSPLSPPSLFLPTTSHTPPPPPLPSLFSPPPHTSAWKHERSMPCLVLTAQEPPDGGGSDDSVHGGDMNGCRSLVLWQRHFTTPPGPSLRRATRGWWRVP